MEKIIMLGTGHGFVWNLYNTCFLLENEKGNLCMKDQGGRNKMAQDSIFAGRLKKHEQELKEKYRELYQAEEGYEKLLSIMKDFYRKRSEELKALDQKREANPLWYRESSMLGMTMYTHLFAGDLCGVWEKLDYLQEQGVTYLHLMPLLKMPHPDNDGGYAVEDFNQVDPPLGTNEDLSHLTAAMRRRGMSLCLDFVINHTADTHEWALRAKAGERAYMDRSICFDSPEIPREMERHIPDVFPETAPGSFLYVEEMGQYVCSSTSLTAPRSGQRRSHRRPVWILP